MSEDWRRAEREKDAMNGRIGWWLVSGMIHDQWVHASSAAEAIGAATNVPEWENPTAQYFGRKP